MNDDARPDDVSGYEPPMVVRLGSLAELTQGGVGAIDDGNMGSGDAGSI